MMESHRYTGMCVRQKQQQQGVVDANRVANVVHMNNDPNLMSMRKPDTTAGNTIINSSSGKVGFTLKGYMSAEAAITSQMDNDLMPKRVAHHHLPPSFDFGESSHALALRKRRLKSGSPPRIAQQTSSKKPAEAPLAYIVDDSGEIEIVDEYFTAIPPVTTIEVAAASNNANAAIAEYIRPKRLRGTSPAPVSSIPVRVAAGLRYLSEVGLQRTEDGHLNYEKDDIINRRFRVLRSLGQGTFGRVICVEDLSNAAQTASAAAGAGAGAAAGRVFAMKVVRNVEKYRRAADAEVTILKHLAKRDKHSRPLFVRMVDFFSYHGHMCILFEKLGISVFDFLKRNLYHPYPMHQVRYMAYQLIHAVSFLHQLGITHTDLKPENMLFVVTDYEKVPVWAPGFVDSNSLAAGGVYRQMKHAEIRLIDFGSAIFTHEPHGTTVTTRHYRAPEVLMELGWSHPCDVWSIACIIFELFTGLTLFQTHDNREHLAMMERILGQVPTHLARRAVSPATTTTAPVAPAAASNLLFNRQGKLLWDKRTQAAKFVNKNCKPLREYFSAESNNEEVADLFNLINLLFEYDAAQRITLDAAIEHRYFHKLDAAHRLIHRQNCCCSSFRNVVVSNSSSTLASQHSPSPLLLLSKNSLSNSSLPSSSSAAAVVAHQQQQQQQQQQQLSQHFSCTMPKNSSSSKACPANLNLAAEYSFLQPQQQQQHEPALLALSSSRSTTTNALTAIRNLETGYHAFTHNQQQSSTQQQQQFRQQFPQFELNHVVVDQQTIIDNDNNSGIVFAHPASMIPSAFTAGGFSSSTAGNNNMPNRQQQQQQQFTAFTGAPSNNRTAQELDTDAWQSLSAALSSSSSSSSSQQQHQNRQAVAVAAAAAAAAAVAAAVSTNPSAAAAGAAAVLPSLLLRQAAAAAAASANNEASSTSQRGNNGGTTGASMLTPPSSPNTGAAAKRNGNNNNSAGASASASNSAYSLYSSNTNRNALDEVVAAAARFSAVLSAANQQQQQQQQQHRQFATTAEQSTALLNSAAMLYNPAISLQQQRQQPQQTVDETANNVLGLVSDSQQQQLQHWNNVAALMANAAGVNGAYRQGNSSNYFVPSSFSVAQQSASATTTSSTNNYTLYELAHSRY